MSKRKRRVFSREFKLSAVQRIIAGEPIAELSRELGVPKGHLYQWHGHYRRGGVDALRPACRPRKIPGAVELTPPSIVFCSTQWHYTPKHGSWLDLAESELGVLSTQCFDRRIPDKKTLIEEIAAWEHDRNAHHTKADWQFTTQTARAKLKHLYPSF